MLSLRATATIATRSPTPRGWRRQTERKNSRSSPSWRIADQEVWMSLLLSRPSPLWVIAPRWVFSPVERSLGNQSQKPCQLAHVLKLPPVADAGQELTGHNPANPTDTHHILNALRQLRVVVAILANFFTHLLALLRRKLHPVQQLIELEAYALRALKLSQLGFTFQRPLAPSRRQRERDAFEKQQRFDPLLGPGSLTHQRVAQLREVA